MEHETWDDRYRRVPRMSSGNPNPTLVTEAAPLAPGRALDVGCGEGADAIWLADNGWTVTAIDIAPTALQRAAEAKSSHPQRVTWLACDITKDSPPAGPYDLVSMHYIPLLTEDADRVVPQLLDTIAPAGTLLFVTHSLDDLSARDGFDPDLYCQPTDIARRLGPEWTITTEEKRPRNRNHQGDGSHKFDTILSCRRMAGTRSHPPSGGDARNEERH